MMASKRTRGFIVVGLLLALLLAGVGSYYASAAPDGLNRVAADKNLDRAEEEHALDDSPLADYSTKGIGNERVSGGLAGVTGVALTFLIAGGVVLAVRRRASATRADHPAEQATSGGADT